MKKFGFKKMLSAVMAASIVTGSVSAINALAASPRIYVDIVYEDANTPRADIYFENVPRLKDIGIHLSIGDGWDTAKSPFGGVKYTKIGTTSNVNVEKLIMMITFFLSLLPVLTVTMTLMESSYQFILRKLMITHQKIVQSMFSL